jgi:radical SAM protein with 4Fe4S-binding SPASM domain
MDRNVADSVLSRLHELGPDALLIVTGGEPLLNWEVTRYLLTVADCLKVLFTNGTLITEEIAVILRETSTCVVVSLDGRYHEHNSARRYCHGGEDTYSDVEKGIFIAKNAGCRIGLSLVAGHHNVSGLSDIFAELVSRFAPESFGFNLQHYSSGSDKKFPVRVYADELSKIFTLAKTAGVYVDQLARRLKPLVTRSFKYHDCAACGSKLVVYPSGKTSNCINYIAYTNGNDSNIWQERTPVTISGCKDCEAIGICGGGCPYDGLSYNNAGSVDRRNCIVTKKLLKTFIQDIYRSRSEFGSYQDINDIYSYMLTRGGISISIGHEIPKDKANKGSA